MSVCIDAHAEPIPGYKLLHRLGSGGFGEVWKAEAPGGIHKAVKVVFGDLRSHDRDLTRFAEQELKSLNRVKQVRHPFLLSLDRIDVVRGRLLITMELADGNLWDRFRECRKQGHPGIPRPELLGYLAEIAEVLDLFDDRFALQHLDIKPQNLFLQNGHIKVADFGQVKDLQGMVAEVTGGITPVYAAPETFDGLVTRYCDQYSLACVYQELLTGRRPFDGQSMNHLLTQHLQLPPDLAPSPPADRPALERALAKEPHDRWPTVTAFVRALRGAGETKSNVVFPGSSSSIPHSALRTPHSQDTPAPRPAVEDTQAPAAAPPDEVTGPGPVRPAVVLGLGGVGAEVVRRFRADRDARYGAAGTPAVRLLVIDTDPDALSAAGFGPEEGYVAHLNRPGHYLKPRLSGKNLTDGWFDPQLLYRIPRLPRTAGLRSLGRLAFCDHYRAVAARLRAVLTAAVAPAALDATADRVGQDVRTNRPRVYVVAGLGGGTGGGMLADAAYLARAELRRLGYADAEVVGLLVPPPPDAPSPALGNAYAALTELHHYAAGGGFDARYDDRGGPARDGGPPFGRCVLPADPATAAELLRLDLFTPVGLAAEDCRLQIADYRLEANGRAGSSNLQSSIPNLQFEVVGLAGFAWPRAEVVNRTAERVAGGVLHAWTAADPDRARTVVPGRAAARWAALGLDPEAVLGRLKAAAARAAGAAPDQLVAATADRLAPKGWFGRPPDPTAVGLAVDPLVRLLGGPPGRPPTPLEEAVRAAAGEVLAAAGPGLRAVGAELADDPRFRPAGAEDVLRQMLATTDRLIDTHRRAAAAEEEAARAGYECVARYTHADRGVKRPPAAELADAVRRFPAARYQSILSRQLGELYRTVRDVLSDVLAEVTDCRERLAAAAQAGRPAQPTSGGTGLPACVRLMPPGCPTVEDAVGRFVGVLTDADLAAIDERVRGVLGCGLLAACLKTAGAAGVAAAVRDEARAYLDGRAGAADVAAMLAARFPGRGAVERAVGEAFAAAAPAGAAAGAWAADEVVVIGCPEGALRETIGRAVPAAGPAVVGEADGVVIYREWAGVPAAALPVLGAAGRAAYQELREGGAGGPHSRTDVTRWADPTAG